MSDMAVGNIGGDSKSGNYQIRGKGAEEGRVLVPFIQLLIYSFPTWYIYLEENIYPMPQ